MNRVNPSMETRLLISGYYGFNNTGDDCLLAVATWGLRSYVSPGTIYATTGNNPVFMPYGSIIPIYRTGRYAKKCNRMAESVGALRAKTIIFGGGSVFHSLSDIKRKKEILQMSGKGPHVAIGVSLGPFKTTEVERHCAEILKRLAFVGLRDRASVDIARSWGVDLNFKETFDLAPLMPRSYHLGFDQLAPAGGKRSGIGIAMCDYERFTGGDTLKEETRRKKIINAVRTLPKTLIDEIVLIDFNGHPRYGDAQIHADIGRAIGRDVKVRYVSYIGNPLAVLRIVGNLRLIIAMRLHAAILGYLGSTPTIMLSYHPKCNGWASQVGLADRFVLDGAQFEVDHLTQLVEERLYGINCESLLGFAEAEQRALSNFTPLGALGIGKIHPRLPA